MLRGRALQWTEFSIRSDGIIENFLLSQGTELSCCTLFRSGAAVLFSWILLVGESIERSVGRVSILWPASIKCLRHIFQIRTKPFFKKIVCYNILMLDMFILDLLLLRSIFRIAQGGGGKDSEAETGGGPPWEILGGLPPPPPLGFGGKIKGGGAPRKIWGAPPPPPPRIWREN